MSLVTTPESTLAKCAACASPRVTSIGMTLTDGTRVDFTSCHKCEHRTWVQAGAAIELDSVITKATRRR